jgi:hypothetical protein
LQQNNELKAASLDVAGNEGTQTIAAETVLIEDTNAGQQNWKVREEVSECAILLDILI